LTPGRRPHPGSTRKSALAAKRSGGSVESAVASRFRILAAA